MIRIISAVPASLVSRTMGKPLLLPFNLTLSVSYNCNSRCRTCNIWKKKARDLTLEEYEKIFKNLGRSVLWATLSGGEPFMRPDLGEVASSLYRNCRPKVINIPTNGLLGEYIAKRSEAIARSCPDSQIVVNLSLDGIGKKHDAIRVVPGNFERAMKAYSALRKIDLPNFTLGVHSVISKFNVSDIPELCDHVLEKLKPDSYITEVAEQRAELDTMGADITPSAEDYAKAVDYVTKRTAAYRTRGVSRFTKAFRSGYYSFAKSVLATNRQPIACYAGIASAQISPEGDVWGCCVRAEPLGNLRENDYDFRKIWFSARTDAFRRTVKKGQCACPLANAYYSSAVCDLGSAFRVLSKLL
jgi:MoaA/NifB/PqqE/SkfB family radical SAM enzyme